MAEADMMTARERLASLGWIPLRSEYFHHVVPPKADVWLGAVTAPAVDGKSDGWTLDISDDKARACVQVEHLSATNSAARDALFQGTHEPGESDADRFAWAHRALCQQGLRLRVSRQGAMGTERQPIRITLTRDAVRGLEAPALVVDVAEGTHCILLEAHERHAAEAAIVQNLQIDVRLGKGARLQHVRVVTPQAQDQLAHLIYASVGESASYEQALIGSGSAYNLQRTELDLGAPSSTGRVGGALFVAGNVLDQQIEALHHDVKTRSEVETLILAKDRARGVVNAMCRMARGAEEAWTRQHLSGIPTSGQPKIVLRPHLVICHDNVEAVHGATWGALPEEALFYARQRGLDERTARALIVKGMMIALLTHSLDDIELVEGLGLPERLDRAVAAYLGMDKKE